MYYLILPYYRYTCAPLSNFPSYAPAVQPIKPGALTKSVPRKRILGSKAAAAAIGLKTSSSLYIDFPRL